MTLAKQLDKDLNKPSDERKVVVLRAAGSIIDALYRNGYDGALAFAIFETATFKMVHVIPKDMEERRELQDVMIDHIKRQLRILEDTILQERITEDGLQNLC